MIKLIVSFTKRLLLILYYWLYFRFSKGALRRLDIYIHTTMNNYLFCNYKILILQIVIYFPLVSIIQNVFIITGKCVFFLFLRLHGRWSCIDWAKANGELVNARIDLYNYIQHMVTVLKYQQIIWKRVVRKCDRGRSLLSPFHDFKPPLDVAYLSLRYFNPCGPQQKSTKNFHRG